MGHIMTLVKDNECIEAAEILLLKLSFFFQLSTNTELILSYNNTLTKQRVASILRRQQESNNPQRPSVYLASQILFKKASCQ